MNKLDTYDIVACLTGCFIFVALGMPVAMALWLLLGMILSMLFFFNVVDIDG